MSDGSRYHGGWDSMGARRWCAECEAWVNIVDWREHRDHGDYRLDFETLDVEKPSMDDIRYCPMCSGEIQPMYGFENDDREKLYAECPEHGPVEIRVERAAAFPKVEDGP